MKDLTKAEVKIVLMLIKSPEVVYNANSISKVAGVTPMGALKILKKLEKELVLKSRKIGKATVYKANVKNSYAGKYISFVLEREVQNADSFVKRWINEVKKIKNAEVIILFGSVLVKQNPNDIDVLFITDQKRYVKLQKEVKELNELNIKKIHPLYQTYKDIVENIQKRDKVILNAIKGLVVLGEEKFIEVYDESRKE